MSLSRRTTLSEYRRFDRYAGFCAGTTLAHLVFDGLVRQATIATVSAS
jgi:hypothetical protein